MKKIVIWTMALALVGIILGLKGMNTNWENIITFGFTGAVLGFCIGFLMHKRTTRE